MEINDKFATIDNGITGCYGDFFNYILYIIQKNKSEVFMHACTTI